MSRWTDITERNRAAVAKNAENVLADTTYDRLRSPRALQALVVAVALTTAAMPFCWLAWGTAGGVASFAAWLIAFLLLRVAVRSLADLPDEVLDERMRAERDSVYVGAFRLVAAVGFFATAAAFVAVAFGDGDETITFDVEAVSAVFWTWFALMLATPSLVLATRRRTTGID